MHIRPAATDDLPFLRRMLYEAAFWDPDMPRPPLAEALASDELSRYVDEWGRTGDVAVVAIEHGQPLGAAWFRLFTAERPGFGFVGEDVPELGVAVVDTWRGRGVGHALLTALVDRARDDGYHSISLSVAVANPAARLYERLGFRAVSTADGSRTMVLVL